MILTGHVSADLYVNLFADSHQNSAPEDVISRRPVARLLKNLRGSSLRFNRMKFAAIVLVRLLLSHCLTVRVNSQTEFTSDNEKLTLIVRLSLTCQTITTHLIIIFQSRQFPQWLTLHQIFHPAILFPRTVGQWDTSFTAIIMAKK